MMGLAPHGLIDVQWADPWVSEGSFHRLLKACADVCVCSPMPPRRLEFILQNTLYYLIASLRFIDNAGNNTQRQQLHKDNTVSIRTRLLW
jgi:hypothetical protein